jgi:hypothetical protein
MGSDMYLAEQSFRPRAPRVTRIDDIRILVERDVFARGWVKAYEGRATPEVLRLLRGLGCTIPKPRI